MALKLLHILINLMLSGQLFKVISTNPELNLNPHVVFVFLNDYLFQDTKIFIDLGKDFLRKALTFYKYSENICFHICINFGF